MVNGYLRQRFSASSRGSVAVLFGVCLFALAGSMGVAVDYAVAYRISSKLRADADAAALAAAVAGRDYFMTHGGYEPGNIGRARSIAQAAAARFFSENGAGEAGSVTRSIDVAIKDTTVDVKITYSTLVGTPFGGLFNVEQVPIAGVAESRADLPRFVEVHLLIDTSGSMALGAGKDEQDLLQAQVGCAFACHDGTPVRGYADSYTYAVANNIDLRYTAVNRGIITLMDTIDRMPGSGGFIRTSVHSFDNTLKRDADLTTDSSEIRRRLPTAPSTSSETAGATHFNQIIDEFVRRVGHGGDGATASEPMKLVILATDGVRDPGRFWVTEVDARKDVGPFDMSFCTTLKQRGVDVGIIHTPYLPMPYDWGYEATLGQASQIGRPGTRADDVPIVLKDCAGPLYVRADEPEAIQSAFSNLFLSVLDVRLTR
ncbi:MAG: pilus assembly protein TadG-related protein [Hyphomicrobiaceae bacterium]|nr:pilus assembly protein TadG-related protein [Hyphomicrobiaceae bacterium]